jgi:hypothetical protein
MGRSVLNMGDTIKKDRDPRGTKTERKKLICTHKLNSS